MERFQGVKAFASNLDDANSIVTNVLLDKFSKIIKNKSDYDDDYNIDKVYEAFEKLKDSNVSGCIDIVNTFGDLISIEEVKDLIKSEDEIKKSINKLDKLFKTYYKKEIFK